MREESRRAMTTALDKWGHPDAMDQKGCNVDRNANRRTKATQSDDCFDGIVHGLTKRGTADRERGVSAADGVRLPIMVNGEAGRRFVWIDWFGLSALFNVHEKVEQAVQHVPIGYRSGDLLAKV